LSQSSLDLPLDDQIINCIVPIEVKTKNGFKPHGTGFLIYSAELGFDEYYLITNKHVLGEYDTIYAIIKPGEGILKLENGIIQNEAANSLREKFESMKFDYNINGSFMRVKIPVTESTSQKNSNVDLAIVRTTIKSKIKKRTNENENFFEITKTRGLTYSRMKVKKEMRIGCNTFFLGFPYAIGTRKGMVMPMIKSDYNKIAAETKRYKDDIFNPLLRTGYLAWKSKENPIFLIDALSYSGNSGSPVFTCSNKQYYLIGVITGHEAEVFKINGNSRGAEGNLGLARAIWVDYLIETLNELQNK